jgi:hypothetical protein
MGWSREGIRPNNEQGNGEEKLNHLASRVSTAPVIKGDVIASFGYPAIKISPHEAGIALH